MLKSKESGKLEIGLGSSHDATVLQSATRRNMNTMRAYRSSGHRFGKTTPVNGAKISIESWVLIRRQASSRIWSEMIFVKDVLEAVCL